jgi:hypothetical protein
MKRVAASVIPTLVFIILVASIVQSYLSRPCTIRGRVTMEGRPVPAGSVLVQSESLQWGTVGMLAPSGEYEITDVPPGPARVGVKSRGVLRSDGGGPLVWTPKRFENPGSSGLGLTVRRGVQRYDIDLPAE